MGQLRVAERLNAAIEAKGWSARRFEEHMKKQGVKGANPPSILSYKHGKVTPPLEFLLAAAAVLEVRAAWLVLGEGDVTEEDAAKEKLPPGHRYRITQELQDAMVVGFPPLSRLDRLSATAVWETWACLSRKAFPPSEETRVAWEASALEAAAALAKILWAPIEACGGDPSTLEPYDLNNYVLFMTQAALRLLPSKDVRDCFSMPVIPGATEVGVLQPEQP